MSFSGGKLANFFLHSILWRNNAIILFLFGHPRKLCKAFVSCSEQHSANERKRAFYCCVISTVYLSFTIIVQKKAIFVDISAELMRKNLRKKGCGYSEDHRMLRLDLFFPLRRNGLLNTYTHNTEPTDAHIHGTQKSGFLCLLFYLFHKELVTTYKGLDPPLPFRGTGT